MTEWKGNEEIFRTYAKGSGKKCVETHVGVNYLHGWDDVQRYSSFGGILFPNIIDISFDDEKMSDTFLDIAEVRQWRCLVLENPETKHIHTFWKLPKNWKHKDGHDIPLACGLVADIHHNDTYIPLRANNVNRFPPVYDILANESYQEVPTELLPVHTTKKLWQLHDGEGRNDVLYGYILVLQGQCHLTSDEIRKMYKDVINPYILADPLSEDELDNILRDETFTKGNFSLDNCFDEKGHLIPNMFGDYIINRDNIVNINDVPHMYKDGVYVQSRDDIERSMLHACRSVRGTSRKEVYEYIRLMADRIEVSDPEYIAFNNGILDIVTGELMDFTPDIVITNRIPWDYNQDAYSKIGDHTLNRVSCDDPAIRALIEECIGSCFYRSAHLAGGMAFIFTGDGANGKSTILDWMRTALGENNVSSMELTQISERFSTAGIYGKLANIGDDISDDFLRGTQVSTFKKIVTGNSIQGENKGEKPFAFAPYCTLIFSANQIPRISDRSNAVMRRLIIVPFHQVFKKSDPDHNDFLLRDLRRREAVEYLIKVGIEGLRRVLSCGHYTQSQQVEKELKEFEAMNNPIIGFLDEKKDEILNQETKDVYQSYWNYCQAAHYYPMTKMSFCKQINRMCGTVVRQKRIDGKRIRIFVKDYEDG